jgi:hypothetical protein
MGLFHIIEGFDSKVTSQVTGSLAVSTDITASGNLRVGNDATIVDELYLPGIENVTRNYVLMYDTATDAVSYKHKDNLELLDNEVFRVNNTGTGGFAVVVSTTSDPSVYDVNHQNIILTNTPGQQTNKIRFNFSDYDPAIYGDFACTIIHKGGPTQDGGFSDADIKLEIYLPNVASVPAGTTYGVSMVGSDGADNYEVEQFTTYTKGQQILFDNNSKWGNTGYDTARRIENSAVVHLWCSFSTNYIIVHSTNWERIY